MDKTKQWPTEKTVTEDRRKTIRYLIPAPIWFEWQAVDGHRNHAIGITCDIGTNGLFVESESVPPVDSVLKLIATLPAGSTFDTTLYLSSPWCKSGYLRNNLCGIHKHCS